MTIDVCTKKCMHDKMVENDKYLEYDNQALAAVSLYAISSASLCLLAQSFAPE